MSTATDSTRLVDDLAGDWTDPALEILKAAGIHEVSVDLELETWQTLKEVLRSELRRPRAFRLSTLVPLGTLNELVLGKAALQVARKFEPQTVSSEFEERICDRPAAEEQRRREGGHYSEMVSLPVLGAAFKPPSRTDFLPHLRASAFHG